MATYQIVYWQDIPSQIDARDASGAAKEVLSQRFQELIDMIAMKRKVTDSSDYIDGWNKGDKVERSGSAADVAKAVAAELEARFEEIRATALAQTSDA